jgi:hypothetical protein
MASAGPAVTATSAAAPTVYFANCTSAFAAGYANIPHGAPGYRSALDRDHDGIACEKASAGYNTPTHRHRAQQRAQQRAPEPKAYGRLVGRAVAGYRIQPVADRGW